MNNWGEIKKLAIVEADDFQDKYDRNGLEVLFYWKAKYPNFKITLFTIPNKISDGLLNLLIPHTDWIEFAWHGWDHDSNYECWEWDYDKTKALSHRLRNRGGIKYGEGGAFKKIFKAPGWMITGGPNGEGSGYPLQPHNKLASDPQAVYKALGDMNYVIFDRHYNAALRPDSVKDKIVCVDCNTDIVHMHTWDMPTGDLNGKNGFRQVEELHGVPWNNETEFLFVSEAWEKGVFKKCNQL